ncbi:MAG: hypothetical protein IH609_13185, partial [Dehalococcoidia bacterium]|nr:hypothetical protein [Dehalococcoidia bacterium]
RPGRREYAVSRVETPRGAAHAALHLQGIDGGDIPIPGSMSAPPALIAERLAHYALWDPTGRAICYVMPSGRTLAARLWRPGEPEAETLTGGTPIFPSWSPDGHRLVLHSGDQLMSVDVESGEQRHLSTNAMGFRTAAISSDGELTAFAEANAQGTALFCYGQAGADPTEVARFEGGVALSFRPGTSELTIAVTTGAEAGVFQDLYVLDMDRPGEPERLIHGPVLAYWWAPTGDRLAVLVPAHTGDGRYQLRFHGSGGVFLRAMEPLTLSPDVRTMVSFFDQFALSHRPWSADGRRFAFGGRLLTDAIPSSFADGQLDVVVVADAVEGGPWVRVGPGFAGFYPPREVNGR